MSTFLAVILLFLKICPAQDIKQYDNYGYDDPSLGPDQEMTLKYEFLIWLNILKW